LARTVVIEGLPRLQRRIEAMTRVGDVTTMTLVANEFVATAQRLVPFDTGALESSIDVVSVRPTEAVIKAGGPDAPYAASQEFGARPHPIAPRRARRLRFFWERENREFIGRPAQAIKHPGNRPQPFFTPAVQTINLATKLRAEIVNLWNSGG